MTDTAPTNQQVVPEGQPAADEEKQVVANTSAPGDKGEEREVFDRPAEYWLACIGFAVGFGNIWRFPFMCYKMGGAAFLIPYCVALFLIAMPMYMVETLYGQLISCKLHHRYGIVSKPFWGITLTQFCVNAFTVVYYITLMAWSFSYFFDSFKNPLPWMRFADPNVAQAGQWCEWNDDNKMYFLNEAVFTDYDLTACSLACTNQGDACIQLQHNSAESKCHLIAKDGCTFAKNDAWSVYTQAKSNAAVLIETAKTIQKAQAQLVATAGSAQGDQTKSDRCTAQQSLGEASKKCNDAKKACQDANTAAEAATPKGKTTNCDTDADIKKVCDAYNSLLTASGLSAQLHQQSLTAQENLWNPDFFYKETLKSSENISDQGSMNGHLVFCLFLSYVFSYFSSFKGIKSTGKMVWVTCTAPYFVLTVLLIKGITLEGSGIGLKALFVPKWSSLADGGIWQAAAVQILFSSGVSFGPLMYYGTARKPEERILKASFWIPMANSLTSLYAALTIFLFLGHVSYMTCLDIDQISEAGLDLAFIAYPGLLGQLAGANFWAIIFFLMLVTLGVDSVFGMLDYSQQMLLDAFPIIEKTMRKEFVCIFICTFMFIWSLMFVNANGLYVFILFNDYACGLSLLICLLLECIFFAWLFGVEKLEVLLKYQNGEYIPTPVKWVVKWFLPIFTVFMIHLNIKGEQAAIGKEEPGYATFLQWMGRLLYIVPLLFIPLGAVFKINSPGVYDLVEEQYKIRFNNKKWNDHSYTKDGQVHGEFVEAEQVLPFCSSANVDVSKQTALILLILNFISHGILGTLISPFLDRNWKASGNFNWQPIALLLIFILPILGWILGVWHMFAIWKRSQ